LYNTVCKDTGTSHNNIGTPGSAGKLATAMPSTAGMPVTAGTQSTAGMQATAAAMQETVLTPTPCGCEFDGKS